MGRTFPEGFNNSICVFPPKGEKETDCVEVRRESNECRPLSLKNSCNKIVGASLNNSVRSAMKKSTHKPQNGFTPSRQLGQNQIDLDCHSRIQAFRLQDRFSKIRGP